MRKRLYIFIWICFSFKNIDLYSFIIFRFMLKLLSFVLLLMGVVDCSYGAKPVYTQVTFLYNIKRSDLDKKHARSFSYYLKYFEMLLQTDCNLIVFGTKQLSEFVWKRRQKNNTVFVEKPLQTFRDYWYFPLAQKVRDKIQNDPKFQYKQAPQFALPFYNGIVFAKYYLMEEAIKHDKWNTDVLIWTDGGLMHVYHRNMVYPENVVRKFFQLFAHQWITMAYVNHVDMWIGYSQNNQFPYNDIMREPYYKIIANIQGGQAQITSDISHSFENLLRITLQNGHFNSQQSVQTIMGGRYPFLMPIPIKQQFERLQNKIHNYGLGRRLNSNQRFWRGILRADGKVQVYCSKQLIKLTFGNEQSIDPVSAILLESSSSVNEEETEAFILLKKIRYLVFTKLIDLKKLNILKVSTLTIAFLFYLFILIKNWYFRRALDQFENRKLKSVQE